MTYHLVEDLDFDLGFDRFHAAFPEDAFILDGAGNDALDQFAFMGAEPVATFRAMRSGVDGSGRARAETTIATREGTTVSTDDPLDLLRAFLEKAPLQPAPMPFRAGLVGYLGYECGQLLERLPCITRPGPGMPDIAFGMHHWVIAKSRRDGRCTMSVLGTDRRAAEQTRDRIRARLTATPLPAMALAGEVTATFTRDEYMARVERAKAHIADGDAFEICFTSSFSAKCADAWSLFCRLRATNAAPFAAYLQLPEGTIVSSSPERFLSLDESRIAESRPIKGTRPRGSSRREDDRLADALATSEKDRAENAMIVDLVRSDLGRVCRPGTIEVPTLHAVEHYATVHQLVSSVRGELAPENDAFDLVRACFPPGSMTGAPKIEAMSILERLEPVERGVYSGAMGWIDLQGTLDLSVVIRTAVVKDGTATFSAGGAVVADSNPSDEYDEAMTKARAIADALRGAP